MLVSVERDSGESGRAAADRLEAVRVEFAAQVRRFEQAKTRLQAIVGQMGKGRQRQEILRHSAFARLQAQLQSMPVIEQAKGILMAQKRCGPDQAFDLLRRASQRANVNVSVLAAQIVEQAALHATGNTAVPAQPAASGRPCPPRSPGPSPPRGKRSAASLSGGR